MGDRVINYTWGAIGFPRPESIPRDIPDRKEHEPVTLLYGPDGKTPILQRVPRPLGFRPERVK